MTVFLKAIDLHRSVWSTVDLHIDYKYPPKSQAAKARPRMRMSQEEKDRSHERIIASAARLIREQGIEGASVHDVMKQAGMTNGGFYKHFDSKEMLLVAALDAAFEEVAQMLRPDAPAAEAATINSKFRAFYLSKRHVEAPGIGCPIAALSSDVARSAAALKVRFGAGVHRLTALLARSGRGAEKERRARAMRQIAMLAGAVMIARASDSRTAQELLVACREGLA